MPLGLAKQARLRGALAATAVSTSLSTVKKLTPKNTNPQTPIKSFKKKLLSTAALVVVMVTYILLVFFNIFPPFFLMN